MRRRRRARLPFSAFVRCDLSETVASRRCVLPGPRFVLRCDAEREGTAGEAQRGRDAFREERNAERRVRPIAARCLRAKESQKL